jgi:nucleotide-binding universal stress UspA family protein
MWNANAILAATDLRAVSRPALERAALMARDHRVALFVLHVNVEPEPARHWLVPPFEEELASLQAFMRRHEAAARERLAEEVKAVTRTIGTWPTELVFRWGRPGDTIVAEGKRLDADMIFVGTRGLPLGAVAERVVTTADRPVMVVPAHAPSLVGRERVDLKARASSPPGR